MFDRCLYFNTNHLSRLIEKRWKDAYSELELAPAHAYLLRLVLKQPGMAQKDIAATLYLEKSTITRFIDKMVNEGYLKRAQAASGSLKEQNIYPTAKAEKIAMRLNEIGDELYKSMQDILDQKTLIQLVSSIRETSEKL
jgi:DNA-binding MarR family transcriptional regulator